MKKKNHIHLPLSVLLAALMLLVTACRSDHEDEPIEQTTRPMTFSSGINATRAIIDSLATLQGLSEGFGVFGSKKENDLFINTQVKYQRGHSTQTNPVDGVVWGTDWVYSPIKYWDVTNDNTIKYDFGAYAPYTNATSGITVSYEANTHLFTISGIPQWQQCDTNDQKTAAYDLLIANNRTGRYVLNDNTCAFPNGIVDFNFYHKLAKIIVTVTKDQSSTLTSIVNEVIIGGNDSVPKNNNTINPLTASQYASVPTDATRSYSRNYLSVDNYDEFDTPDSLGTKILYSDTTGKEVVASPNSTLVTTYLVVPFELSGDKTIPITVNYKTDNNGTYSTYSGVPSSTSLKGFKAGNIYNINIKLLAGTQNIVTAVVEVQEWGDGGSTDDDVFNW